jgi:LPXTG-motif cell wall-anchored protein
MGKRFRAAFITIFIVQIIAVIIVFEEFQLHKSIVELFGISDFLYSNLIFPLLGLIILATSIYSFRKRRSYLA